MPNFVKIGQYRNIAIFRFFKTAAAAFLDFRVRKILLADGVWRAEEHHHKKMSSKSVNQLRRYCNFLFFFQDGGRAISWICLEHICTLQRVLGGAEFGYDRCASFENMNVSIFCGIAFGWKKFINAPKIVFFFWGGAIWPPK